MSGIVKFLEDVPLPDALERRNAPAVQVVLLLLGVVPPIVWTFFRASAVGDDTARWGGWALSITALAALAVLRRGYFRFAVGMVLVAFVGALAVSFLSRGLEARRSMLPITLFPLVFAALLVGRRTLWLLLLSLVAVLVAAAVRDVPSVWPDVATALHPRRNNVLSNVVFTTLFLTVILDRFGSALRETYRAALSQAHQLGEANAQLQVAESRFRAAVEGSLDAFLLLSAVRNPRDHVEDFVVTDANERAAVLSSTARQDLGGRRLSDLNAPGFRDERSVERYVRVLQSREAIEAEFASPGPPARWFRQQVVPVGDGVAVILRDLTAQRTAEAEASALREQFLQAQKMEVVGVLAGSVAHDFNNLLTVIGGHAELLKSDDLTATSREGVDQIVHATRRAVDLTRTLLAFGRRQVTRPRVMRLGDALRESRKVWERLLGSPVALRLDLHDERPVRLDRSEFEQIVLNLLVNARDAMPAGGRITLRVSTAAVRGSVADADVRIDRGDWTVLEVRDTGTGMTEEVAHRIFEPFFTTKPPGRGTGLGLSTVRRLVTEQGGHITVTSRPGAGTIFRIYWPAVDATVEADTVAPANRRPAGSETVLLVDDDHAVRQLFATGLAALGYHVLSAATGAQAVDLSSTRDVDIVVTDLVLPDFPGTEVIARLQQRRPRLPVIVMSGFADPRIPIDPSHRFVQKPVMPRDLAAHVRAALDESISRAEEPVC